MLRDWKLNLHIDLDRSSKTAVYVQIAQALVIEIRRGRLKPGSVLPGTRELAEELGVNRKTIINVYDELTAQGWLVSNGTKGTFVSSTLPSMAGAAGWPALRPGHQAGEAAQFAHLTTIGDVPIVQPRTGDVWLDDGTPDTRLFPADQFARAYRGALTLAGRQGRLTYDDPRGSLQLRSSIAAMLNVERGLATEPDRICLTRGSQMAIYLVAKALIHPGDAVVLEELTYPPAREAFRSLGATIVTVPIDDDGPDMEALERACRTRPIRFVYVTPHHHFPTTRLMRPERRLRLLQLAETFGFLIMEDDYDHEFHFQHQPLLPLASVDPFRVVYIGSLSKLLAPSLRIGYLAAPSQLVERVAKEIVLIDRQGDQATANAAADLIEAGELQRHARKALRIYARRREMLAGLLHSELGDAVEFRIPDGGLAFWLSVHNDKDLDTLEANADRAGLRFLPSRSFADEPGGRRGIRMGFARLDENEMKEAVSRLKRCLRGEGAKS